MKRLVLLAVLFSAACHREPSSHALPEASGSASLALRDASAEGAPSTSGPCAALAGARTTYDGGPYDPLGPTLDCKLTKHGAWGLFTSTLDGQPMYSGAVQVNLAYTANGQTTIQRHEVWTAVDRVALYDLDGDGEEELMIEGKFGCGAQGDGWCSDPRPVLELLTAKNGAVGTFVPSNLKAPPGVEQSHLGLEAPGKLTRFDSSITFSAAPDVDGDGRPDLVTSLFYEMSVSDGDVSSYSIHGPGFVAHALADHTFSFTDDVAMAALRADCDATVPFEKADGSGLLASSVCARLHGKSVGEIRQRYVARCVRILAENERLQKNGTNEGADYYATGACRTAPEGGWSGAHGIPVAFVKMLEETQPLLVTRTGNAKP